MAWYVVHVGHVPGIYETWEECFAQVNRYPGNCYKKYYIEAEALKAYYTHPAYLGNHGLPLNANHTIPSPLAYLADHGQATTNIEDKPLVEDVKIRRWALCAWKDVMLLFMAMIIAFLIWK